MLGIALGVQDQKLICQQFRVINGNLTVAVKQIYLFIIDRAGCESGVEGVVVDFSALIIHDFESECIGFEAQVDIFADKDDISAVVFEQSRYPQNTVIRTLKIEFAAEDVVNAAPDRVI